MGISLIRTPAGDNDGRSVRVAFYMRVSTAEQELEGYSPEFQKNQMLDHVRRKEYRGWETRPEWHYFDVGSGSEVEGRPHLQRMIQAVRAGELDIVLVWKIDRLSRNLSDLLRLFDEFSRHRVGFASMKEDLDFTGPIGRLIYQVFGALAEFERETIKMRTEEGRKASALAGNYTGTVAPYGFRSVPNPGGKGRRLEAVAEEAEVVRRIFGWFVHGGRNAAAIAAELNRLAVPKGRSNAAARGTVWHEWTVRSMLGSEEYRGVFITNRYRLVQKRPRRHVERPREEWIVVRTPALVDDVLFYMAQERLRETSRRPAVGGGKENYLLRGKLVEAHTGRRFVGYLSAKKTKNYRRKRYTAADGTRHPAISVAAAGLERFVWGHIVEAIERPEAFLRMHQEGSGLEEAKEGLSEQLRFYEGRVSELNEKLGRVNEDYYARRIDDAERRELVDRYKGQRDEALAGRLEAERELARLGRYREACGHLREFSEQFRGKLESLDEPGRRALVDLLVDRIEIGESPEERTARVLFRFDPREIASAIGGVEPAERSVRPQRDQTVAVSERDGGSDALGYVFGFRLRLGPRRKYRRVNLAGMQKARRWKVYLVVGP